MIQYNAILGAAIVVATLITGSFLGSFSIFEDPKEATLHCIATATDLRDCHAVRDRWVARDGMSVVMRETMGPIMDHAIASAK